MQILSVVKKHLRRSPYQSLAAILTMFLTLFLTGFFSLTIGASIAVLNYFESKPQITVFFTDKAGEAEAMDLKKSLEETGKTAGAKYISKDDALNIYKEQNKNDPLLLEMVTAEILPASLEVSATDPKYLAQLEPLIKQAAGVEEVIYQKDVVDALLVWTRAIRLTGSVLALLFIINSLLIIMTIITMKIALKKEEIEILKLVGASVWYIRLPFIFEGGLYGVFGGIIAGSILSGLIFWFQPALISILGIIPFIQNWFSNPASWTFILSVLGFWAALILTGTILGALGSAVALARYLKF